MTIWWAKANYCTTTTFRIKWKIYNIYNNSKYLQITSVNWTLLAKMEILDHLFKSKIMLNTTAALFTKVIVRMVKTMSMNPWEMLFKDGLSMKTQISNQNQLNTWNIFLTINLNGKCSLGRLNTRGKGKF